MKRILLTALVALTPASASANEELDASLRMVTRVYASMRIAATNCNLEPGDWLSLRSRIIASFLEYPRVDILKLERDIDRFYEHEKSWAGTECYEETPGYHQEGIDRSELYLKSLRDEIAKAKAR